MKNPQLKTENNESRPTSPHWHAENIKSQTKRLLYRGEEENDDNHERQSEHQVVVSTEEVLHCEVRRRRRWRLKQEKEGPREWRNG